MAYSPSITRVVAEAFPPNVRQALIAAVEDSYSIVRARYHDPADGCNNHTFYTLVWNFILQRFLAVAADPGLPVKKISVSPLQLSFGPFIASPYRLPFDIGDDVGARFPYNDSGAGQLVEMNRHRRTQGELLPPHFDNPDIPAAFVLAHAGNPERGFLGLYLMEPVNENAGRISEWGYQEPLWTASADSVGLRAANLPPEELVERPVVRPRLRIVRQDETIA